MAKRESAPAPSKVDINIVSGGTYEVKPVLGQKSGDQQVWDMRVTEDQMLANFGYGKKKDLPKEVYPVATPEDSAAAFAAREAEEAAAKEAATDGEAGPKPGEIGGVKRTPPEKKPAEKAPTAKGEKVEPPVLEDGKDKETTKTPEEEASKEAALEQLMNQVEFMLDAGAGYAEDGNLKDCEKAFDNYLKIVDTIIEMNGWDKSLCVGYFRRWTIVVGAVMSGKNTDEAVDKDAAKDPTITPDEAKDAKKIAASESLTHLSGLLAVSRDRLARLNVKASGRIRVGRKLKEELEDARREWEALQVEVGARTMEQIIDNDPAISQANMRTLAAQGAMMEGAALSQAQLAAVAAGPDGGRIKRALHWYARKYNEGGRFKKAIMLAPAGLLVGTGIGTIFGAIGGGIAGGLIAKGAVGGALRAKMQALQSRGGNQVDVSSFNISLTDEEMARAPFLLARRAACLNRSATAAEVSSDTRENKKRAGIAIGVGSIIGAASGIAANYFTDQHPIKGSGLVGKKTGWDPFDGQDHPTGSPGTELAPIPELPSIDQGQYDVFMSMKGSTPWQRAVRIFGEGKSTYTPGHNWLVEAVERTPGASWRDLGDGIGHHDYITVNGVSDVDTVWKALSETMATKP